MADDIANSEQLSVPQIFVAGISTASVLLFFDATGIMSFLYRFLPPPVVRGVHTLAFSTIKYIRFNQDFVTWKSGSSRSWLGLDGLVVAISATIFLILTTDSGESYDNVIVEDLTFLSALTNSCKITYPDQITDTSISHTLISSLFATVSSFEASYLQLQTAHVPFDEENIKAADRAFVSHLRNISEIKQFYRDLLYNPNFNPNFSFGSCLESQVQENQSKLRSLGTVANRLQRRLP